MRCKMSLGMNEEEKKVDESLKELSGFFPRYSQTRKLTEAGAAREDEAVGTVPGHMQMQLTRPLP